ncbi:uncharacterized protein LOC141608300 [Silene latifolia]|uniref:uncharacterized protein LOC141608300 n=1 Tax=Silene latifolia TaxID=37657 RepID=UPI003D77F56F
MEVLSLMITKAESQRAIEGIKLSHNSPSISHLLYADDSLLCLCLTPASGKSLRNILNSFTALSGQMINNHKSYIKFSPNTPDDFKEHLLNILKVQSQQNFGLYLGVPIDLGKRKTGAFQFLLDKISSKILSWGPASFSQASKLLLINSILMTSIAYVASVLPIPLQITNKINYLIDLFLWKKAKNKCAQHWLPPERLQLPMSEGGLRIKNATIVSQALLSKTFWRCHHKPHSLVSRILRSKYQKDFPVPDKVPKYTAASFAWKGVVKNTYLLQDGIAWKFGNGKLINIKNDAWILGKKPCFKPNFQSQDFSFTDLLFDPCRWNMQNVFKYFHSESAKKICSIELPLEPMDDYIYWKSTEDGRYSSCSEYSFLLKNSLPSVASSFSRVDRDFQWSLIWHLPCQPHIKLFLWKIVQCILPTADVLIRREMPVNPICSFCHKDGETLSHLFRDCDIIKRVWAASLLGICSDVSSHVSIGSWFQIFFRYLSRLADINDQQLLYFPLTLYAIWKHRNNVIFREADNIVREIDLLSKQQHVFNSNIKALDQSSCRFEDLCFHSSFMQHFSHFFRMEIVFSNKTLIGSFKVYRNVHLTHEVLQCFCSSRLQINIMALIEAMTFASAFRLENVLFQINGIRLLRLMRASSLSSVPITLSGSISRIKFFLSCNHTWYCDRIV